MDKIAMVKIAEVNGVLAALAEAELVKIASEEDFGIIAEAVASNLPDQYGMDDVLAKTAEVMEEVYAQYDKLAEEAACEEKKKEMMKEEGKKEDKGEKTAEVTVQDCLDAYAELTVKKQAGEISEEDFTKEAAFVAETLQGLNKVAAEVPAPAPVPTALDKLKALKK